MPHQQAAKDWAAGYFGCPVQFRTHFELYHRCAASQVIPQLEATVLDSFAVSNRRGVFVYKDETGAIFYMRLNLDKVGDDDIVELLVFGVDEPDSSVTQQLKRLLQKRLVSIAVDCLSLLLLKNPLFNWKPSDLQFVRSFEKGSRDLDQDEKPLCDDKDCIYEFPPCVNDPLMVLVYFRQNICGSTYFHRLHEATEEDSNRTKVASPDVNGEGATDSTTVIFDEREFAFFFNSSPSGLDEQFQPYSTLTFKGAQYSRQVGTGIALVEINLLNGDGSPVKSLEVGASPSETESVVDFPMSSLRFRRVDLDGENEHETSPFRIRVKLISTSLNRQSLHNWIEL